MQLLSPEPGDGNGSVLGTGGDQLKRGLPGAASDFPAPEIQIAPDPGLTGALSRLRLAADATLFQQVVAAHGIDPKGGFTLGIQNFVVGPASRDGVPFAPLSDPNGDIYLGFSGPAASGASDVVISNRCQPGYLDYLRQIGLLDQTTTVIEVDPLVIPGKIGWPNSDPMSRLLDFTDQRPSTVAARHQLESLIKDRGTPYFVSTFLSEAIREQALTLGAQPVQRSNPVDLNKASFRNAAAAHGFTIADGLVVESEMDLPKLTELALDTIIRRIENESPYEKAERGTTEGWTTLWMKLQDGSGGDFVKKVFIPREAIETVREIVEHLLADKCDPQVIASTLSAMDEGPVLQRIIENQIIGARSEVRKTLAEACDANDYGPHTLERMWPHDSFAPTAVAMVAEQDARVKGTMLANASNVIIINDDGTYLVDGYFKQVTGSDGSYRGSYPFSPRAEFGAEVTDRLQNEMDAVVSWIYKLGFRGRIGVDFFVMQNPQGEISLIMTEVNGRAPISGVSKVIAEKLGAPAWLNINIETPGPLNSMDDFKRQFGEHADFIPGDFSRARVIPQAMRALYSDDELVYASSKVKALIVGPTQEACFALRRELSEKGFIL